MQSTVVPYCALGQPFKMNYPIVCVELNDVTAMFASERTLNETETTVC